MNTASANVHKGPSTASPVTAPFGARRCPSRELGSWASELASAVDASAIHEHWFGRARTWCLRQQTTSHRIARPRVRQQTLRLLQPSGSGRSHSPAPARNVYVTPMTHTLGVGATMGPSPVGFGVSGRAWHRSHFGAQLDYSHYSTAAPISPDRVASTQFEPSVMFHFRDHVADSIWLRPYAGSGVSFGSETLTMAEGSKISESRFGVQAFGGAEVTFPGMSRFALSAGMTYRWTGTIRRRRSGGLGFVRGTLGTSSTVRFGLGFSCSRGLCPNPRRAARANPRRRQTFNVPARRPASPGVTAGRRPRVPQTSLPDPDRSSAARGCRRRAR